MDPASAVALISAIAGLIAAAPGLVRDVQAIVDGGGTPEEIATKLAGLASTLVTDKARVAAVYPPDPGSPTGTQVITPPYVPDPKPTAR